MRRCPVTSTYKTTLRRPSFEQPPVVRILGPYGGPGARARPHASQPAHREPHSNTTRTCSPLASGRRALRRSKSLCRSLTSIGRPASVRASTSRPTSRRSDSRSSGNTRKTGGRRACARGRSRRGSASRRRTCSSSSRHAPLDSALQPVPTALPDALLLLRPPPAPSAQFNSMWDNKMKEYEQRAGELLEAMRQVRAGARANPSPDPGPGALTVPQPASLALNPQPSGTCSTCGSSTRRRRRARRYGRSTPRTFSTCARYR